MERWTLIREYCLNSHTIPNVNALQPGVTEMINYLSTYSFCLLSTCNKTGVLSELNSCKQEHSTWENSQNSFWHFQPQNVRICQGLKHWISLPHIKKDNISFLDSETLSNLHPTAIDGVQNSIRAACGYHAESRIFTHLLRSERVSMPRIWKHHVMSHTEVQSQYYRMKAATRKQPRNSQEYTPAPLQPWANEKLPALLTAPSRARHGKYIIHTLRTVTKLELKM